MKKILALILMLCVVFSLAACGGTSTPAASEAPAADASEAPAEATEVPAADGAEYTLGMGVELSTGSSKTGTAQVDATSPPLSRGEGKIVSCRIDCAPEQDGCCGRRG